MPVDDNMNRATRHFLDSTDCDYMLRLDADQSPVKNPLDLIELSLDVVGGVAHRWDGRLPVKFSSKHRDDAPFDGLQRVEVAGGGCLLIKRSVFERIGTGWWTHIYNKHGYMSHGDDVAFCLRCKGHGIPVHVHYDYVCRHFKTVDLLRLVGNFEASK